MTIEIDETHQKVIQISFWMLDQLLCRFDQWAMKHEVHSILYEETNTLSDQQCSFIHDEIKAIRILLKQLKDELGLERHREPVNKIIHVTSILFVTDNLMPIQGKGLDAYGNTADVLELINEIEDHTTLIDEAYEESA